MLLDFITFYGTVISSFTTEPLSDVGSLYVVGTGLLIVIVLFKELTKGVAEE